MNKLWQDYSEKFLAITTREQYLILLSGLVAITFIIFYVFIDENMINNETFAKDIKRIESSMKSQQQTVVVFQQALSEDPNQKINEEIGQFEDKLNQIDTALLTLTSDLIDPVQMRFALIDLLKMQKGVSLLSFQVIKAEPVSLAPESSSQNKEHQSDGKNEQAPTEQLTLYKHGIKLKLSGPYFKLRDYLTQLENLQWKFFWQRFDYQLSDYPKSELEVEVYSLSTKREFIGV